MWRWLRPLPTPNDHQKIQLMNVGGADPQIDGGHEILVLSLGPFLDLCWPTPFFPSLPPQCRGPFLAFLPPSPILPWRSLTVLPSYPSRRQASVPCQGMARHTSVKLPEGLFIQATRSSLTLDAPFKLQENHTVGTHRQNPPESEAPNRI